MSSFFDKNSESNPTTEDSKKQSWKDVLGLISKQKFDEAFSIVLSSEDDMQLIRLLSKTGCKDFLSFNHSIAFEFDKLQDQ